MRSLFGVLVLTFLLTGCGEERRAGYTRDRAEQVARELCPGLPPDRVHCEPRGNAWRCDTSASNGNVGIVIVASVSSGTMSPCH